MDNKQENQEVVLFYSPTPPKEVVLCYRGAEAKEEDFEQEPYHNKGLVIFLGCLAFLVLVLGGILLWLKLTDTALPQVENSIMDLAVSEITIPVYDPEEGGGTMTLTMVQDPSYTPQEIYALVNPAVVTVLCEVNGVDISMGTGVIYTRDGYIVTNYHVIEGANDCAVALSTGEVLQAYYVAGDEENDLAVLKVNGTGLPTATFAQSDLLAVGDTVYAIGNPLGLELRGTFTDGMVSAINRDVEVDGRWMSTLIQTNAALNSGNSGGPLINIYGQVVGINTVKMGSGSTSVEGIGFAIPSATVQRIVQDLVTVGEVQPEPIFGITVGSVATELSDGTIGAEIFSVTPETPAAVAGIQVGDLLLYIDGEVVEDSADVLRVRRQLRIGDTVEVILWRNGRLVNVEMELTMS